MYWRESENSSFSLDDKIKFNNIEHLNNELKTRGCKRCDLGLQDKLNGICISKGDYSYKRMIIGEGPGKYEDLQSKPFVGPAGKLLDKLIEYIDLDPNTFYMTNIILCRPIAEKGSGKENYTPRVSQMQRCAPFLKEQIRLIQPKIIITLGRISTQIICNSKNIRMGDYRGKLLDNIPRAKGALVFPLYHPAYILHNQNNVDKYNLCKEQMIKDLDKLKLIIKERNL